jgi:hypothetical protein
VRLPELRLTSLQDGQRSADCTQGDSGLLPLVLHGVDVGSQVMPSPKLLSLAIQDGQASKEDAWISTEWHPASKSA